MSTPRVRIVTVILDDGRRFEADLFAGEIALEGISFGIDRLRAIYNQPDKTREWVLTTGEKWVLPSGRAGGTISIRIPGALGQVDLPVKDIAWLADKE